MLDRVKSIVTLGSERVKDPVLPINPLTPGTFCKNVFFGHLVLFKLDLGQISFNLVENVFATQQLAFLATSIAFICDSGMRRNQNFEAF